MKDWQEIKDLGLGVLKWWEMLVKPGIKKLAIQRSKELNWEKRGELNLLLLRQAYLAKKLQEGDLNIYGELRCVQVQVDEWYQKDSEKILIQHLVSFVQNQVVDLELKICQNNKTKSTKQTPPA